MQKSVYATRKPDKGAKFHYAFYLALKFVSDIKFRRLMSSALFTVSAASSAAKAFTAVFRDYLYDVVFCRVYA